MQNNFGIQGEPLPVERADGTLFRFGPGDKCEAHEQNTGVSDTLAWSPDARLFYFADSVSGCIYVYDYDVESATLANKCVHFNGPDYGIPDGSTIDVAGCLWNARWDDASIIRITPEGRVDRKIDLPIPHPTSCIFGGSQFETLYVTSVRLGLSKEQLDEYPLSGSVFAFDGLAQGMRVPQFVY